MLLQKIETNCGLVIRCASANSTMIVFCEDPSIFNCVLSKERKNWKGRLKTWCVPIFSFVNIVKWKLPVVWLVATQEADSVPLFHSVTSTPMWLLVKPAGAKTNSFLFHLCKEDFVWCGQYALYFSWSLVRMCFWCSSTRGGGPLVHNLTTCSQTWYLSNFLHQHSFTNFEIYPRKSA